MKSLSPSAQAVLDTANGFNSYSPDDVLNESRWIVAAALRAAADQVVPVEPKDEELDCDDKYEWYQWSQRQHTRRQLLAIAAELEGADG